MEGRVGSSVDDLPMLARWFCLLRRLQDRIAAPWAGRGTSGTGAPGTCLGEAWHAGNRYPEGGRVAAGGDQLPLDWIVDEKDARRNIRVLDRRVYMGTATVRAPIGSSPDTLDESPVASMPAGSDTVIRVMRFADGDPASRDELTQVVPACRRFGCRIGIRGLQESRFTEFSEVLHKLGADSLPLTPEPSANTTFAMLVIAPSHIAARR